jgi:hypothetical protein
VSLAVFDFVFGVNSLKKQFAMAFDHFADADNFDNISSQSQDHRHLTESLFDMEKRRFLLCWRISLSQESTQR